MLAADSVAAFAISDENGYFEIPAPKGKYKLALRYVGFVNDTLDIDLRRDIYLGVIKLKPDSKQLKGAEIKASLSDNAIDKDEYLITAKMRTGTANSYEVLDRVNGIHFDRYKNDIKVDNSSNIIFLVNGIEKNKDYVQSINPDRIAKVEIIRDPSGKYGIEGYYAIVNLILKTNYKGNDLFVSNMAIYDYKNKTKGYYFPVQNFNANYNYTNRNLNIYTGFYGGINRFALKNYQKKTYSDTMIFKQLPFDSTRNMKARMSYYAFEAGADYRIDKSNIISLEINGDFNPGNDIDMKYNTVVFKKDSILPSDDYSLSTKQKSSSFIASLFYIGNYGEDKKLKADASWGLNNDESTNNYVFGSTPPNIVKQQNNIRYFKSNIEWNQTITPKFSYQTGGGITYKSMSSISTTDTLSRFAYPEFRSRFFAYALWRPLKKLSLKFGMGTENSTWKIDDEHLTFRIFKPHVDLFYKASKMLSFKLKYRTDTYYPSLEQANPQTIPVDINTVSKGNPDIKPTSLQKLSLRINVLGGLLYAEGYYHFSDNYITPVTFVDSSALVVNSYFNSGKYLHKGLKFSITIPFGKSIVWQNTFDIYHSEMSYDIYKNSLNDMNGESQLMYVNQKSGLVAGLLYQRYNSKSLQLQGYSNEQNDFWGFFIQKPFFDKRFNVMFMAFLPIDYLADYTQVTYVETPSYSQKTLNDISILKNMLMLRLSYRFHRGKEIKTIEKNVEKEENVKHKSLF